MSISSASMTIRSAFERRSGSKEGLSHLRIGMRGRWLPIALALSLRAKLSAGTNRSRNGRITTNRTDELRRRPPGRRFHPEVQRVHQLVTF